MTLSEPFWFEDLDRKGTRWEGYRHLVRCIRGLSASAHYAKDGPDAMVDASIAPLILRLNESGYPTLFCCSGLAEEHSPYDPFDTGYISFGCEVAPLVPFLPKGLKPDGGSILRWSRGSTQDQRRVGWQSLYAGVASLYTP